MGHPQVALCFFRCLELSPNLPKALFCCCQAYQALEKVDAASKGCGECHLDDPNSTALQPILIRLHKAVSKKDSCTVIFNVF
jgi:hypothetical protein